MMNDNSLRAVHAVISWKSFAEKQRRNDFQKFQEKAFKDTNRRTRGLVSRLIGTRGNARRTIFIYKTL